MGFYINQNHDYYEGDKVDYRDIDVPQRPSYLYDWINEQWVINTNRQAQEVEKDNYKASIRRQAKELSDSGKGYDALILLKTIGE